MSTDDEISGGGARNRSRRWPRWLRAAVYLSPLAALVVALATFVLELVTRS